MNEHRYILEKGSKKYHCSGCDKKTFVRYVDTETGNYLPEQYGRCDRESKCNYHLNPYLSGYANVIRKKGQCNRSEFPNNLKLQRKAIKSPLSSTHIFIPKEVLKQTLQLERYEQNIFIQNLLARVEFPFQATDIEKVVSLYYLGTVSNGYRAGAITFPFIDINTNIRAVQVKQFDETNTTTSTDFLHSIIEKYHTRSNKPLSEWLKAYKMQDKRVSCLFGEHLLMKYPHNPVALVEAPKTAIYGSLYFGLPEHPEDLLWLAVYNKSSFSFDKIKVLQGRNVLIFPDLSKDGRTFNEWQTKASEFEKRLPGIRFVFSDLLERLAPETDKQNGYDFADYLIKQDWRLFRKEKLQQQHTTEPVPKLFSVETKNCKKCDPQEETFLSHVELMPQVIEVKTEHKQPEDWSKDISDLETYFSGIVMPTQPVRLNSYSTIINVSLFIESHINTLKTNNGNSHFKPHLDRLKELQQCLN